MNIQDFFEKYPDTNMAEGIVELGYDDKPAIFANWNDIPAEVYNELESAGYSCEWIDGWITCDSCNKAFRTSPDSYSWEMFGVILGGYAMCGECMDMPEYLESIENIPTKALTCTLLWRHKPLEEYGYQLVQGDYENGFHEGQNDDPKKILASLLEKNPAGRFIFVIDSQGQFDISFSVYQRIENPE